MITTEPGQIVGPSGELLNRPITIFTPDEARLLRQYRRFLEKYHLREALYCAECWNQQLNGGCEAYVTQDQILIQCRCKTRFFHGMTL